MNRDNPKIVSDKYLHKRVFKYDSSVVDNRYFRQRIIDFLNNSDGKSFSQFMFHAIWERNGGGSTLKYCEFNERSQKVNIDPYFYEWMVRSLRKAEHEIKVKYSFTH